MRLSIQHVLLLSHLRLLYSRVDGQLSGRCAGRPTAAKPRLLPVVIVIVVLELLILLIAVLFLPPVLVVVHKLLMKLLTQLSVLVVHHQAEVVVIVPGEAPGQVLDWLRLRARAGQVLEVVVHHLPAVEHELVDRVLRAEEVIVVVLAPVQHYRILDHLGSP